MRVLRVVAVVAALAVGVAACSGEDPSTSLPKPNKAFCQAAYDYDTNLPKLVGKVAEQIALIRKMAANAPADVKDDAHAFLSAMEKYQQGDRSKALGSDKVKKAVDNVERRANNGCGLFKQDPPSGM